MNVTIVFCVPNDPKKSVARHTCNILIRWSYLTWPAPWPLLSLRSALTFYLPHSLGSLFARFELSAVISPVRVTDMAKSDDFDIWPDLDLTCDLLRNLKKCSKSIHRELSISASPVSLRPPVRELATGGKIYLLPLPPPQRDAFGQISQRGAG